MKTWGTSETSAPKYATIWITQCGNPQTDGWRIFRNPLLKPDCLLRHKDDSLTTGCTQCTIGSPFNPSSSLHILNHATDFNDTWNYLSVLHARNVARHHVLPTSQATLQSVAAKPIKQHNTQVRHSDVTFQCCTYLTNKHNGSWERTEVRQMGRHEHLCFIQ